MKKIEYLTSITELNSADIYQCVKENRSHIKESLLVDFLNNLKALHISDRGSVIPWIESNWEYYYGQYSTWARNRDISNEITLGYFCNPIDRVVSKEYYMKETLPFVKNKSDRPLFFQSMSDIYDFNTAIVISDNSEYFDYFLAWFLALIDPLELNEFVADHTGKILENQNDNLTSFWLKFKSKYPDILFQFKGIDLYEIVFSQLSDSSKSNSGSIQIEWLGTQKELAELFVELERKGFIEALNPDIVKTIQASFTKSSTIDQILKRGTDRITKIDMFPDIFTKSYRPSFDTIKARRNARSK